MAEINYPENKIQPVIEDYFGHPVVDDHRWLEDDNSSDTLAWVIAQNTVTRGFLDNIPFRGVIRAQLEQIWNYSKYSAPFREGHYLYFFKNDGLQNQSVLYRQANTQTDPEEFLNPNKLSQNGTVALGRIEFSKSAKFAAYSINSSGSDWSEAFIMDVETKSLLPDKVSWLKFSHLSWLGDEGFFYSRYPEPVNEKRLSGQNRFHSIYYHPLSAHQTEDILIYEDREHPLRYHFAEVTEDNNYLVINKSEGTSGAEIVIIDLKKGFNSIPVLLFNGYESDAHFVQNEGDRFLIHTNKNALNYRIVSVDLKSPNEADWNTIVDEKPEVMETASTCGGNIFASYLKDASSNVCQLEINGKLIREIMLPGIGTAIGFRGKRTDDEFYYTYTSYTRPATIYKFTVATGTGILFKETELSVDLNQFETRQIFFNSKDDTSIPIFISFKRGMVHNGNNPLLLYAYGGFNISLTPSFSLSNLYFMQNGGIYAVVNTRGGGEYGEAWHKAGMLQNKQNVFDDFMGAAEYLIREKYTNPRKLAIEGGSNGGLLVGACMTQRPDLFKVALPAVGVLDMLRFQKFTVGFGWVVEYGTSEKEEDFNCLIKYSPYHNLRKGMAYPATLITTANHDDRVVPAHSFKFAARLQEYHGGEHPVLISIEMDAGHGTGKPVSKLLDQLADKWAFVFEHLEVYPG